MNLTTLHAASITALALAACGGLVDQRPAQYAELKTRAAFDLKCSEADLAVVPLAEMKHEGRPYFAKTAGVTCKDVRATYEYAEDYNLGWRWLMNNGRSAPRDGAK